MAGALTTLSEAESKALVARFGVPVPDERVGRRRVDDAVQRSRREIGYPVVVKLCGAVDRAQDRTGTRAPRGCAATADVEVAAAGAARRGDGRGRRGRACSSHRCCRAIASSSRGCNRDPQFGMTVMLGIGGVLAEAVADVTFRRRADRQGRRARDDRRSPRPGVARRRCAANRRSTASASPTCCSGSPTRRSTDPTIQSVDLNPLIVVDGVPVAVDALVEVER